jgi:hypothetical protein
MRARVLLSSAWVTLVITASAGAQTTDRETQRRDLVRRAITASQQNDHTQALDLATQAGQIRMTTALRMLLAQEHNSLGHLLDAYDFSVRCVREAETDPGMADRTQILDGCNAVLSSVRDRIGRVALRTPDPLPDGARVRVQGSEVNVNNLGIPCPVLPGSVLIEVTARGGSFHHELTISAGETREVIVTLSPNEPPRRAPDTTAPTTPTPTTPTSRRGPGAGPWIVAGVGVASFAAAAVFYFGLRAGALNERDTACAYTGGYICNEGRDAQDQARTWAALATAANIAGGVALAGATVWFILARPRGDRTPPRTTWNWNVTPTAGGLSAGIGGRF